MLGELHSMGHLYCPVKDTEFLPSLCPHLTSFCIGEVLRVPPLSCTSACGLVYAQQRGAHTGLGKEKRMAFTGHTSCS